MKTNEKKEKKARYQGNLILKKAVSESGYKVSGLARKLGVTPKYLSMIINGDRKGVKTAKELIKLLEI